MSYLEPQEPVEHVVEVWQLMGSSDLPEWAITFKRGLRKPRGWGLNAAHQRSAGHAPSVDEKGTAGGTGSLRMWNVRGTAALWASDSGFDRFLFPQHAGGCEDILQL